MERHPLEVCEADSQTVEVAQSFRDVDPLGRGSEALFRGAGHGVHIAQVETDPEDAGSGAARQDVEHCGVPERGFDERSGALVKPDLVPYADNSRRHADGTDVNRTRATEVAVVVQALPGDGDRRALLVGHRHARSGVEAVEVSQGSRGRHLHGGNGRGRCRRGRSAG